MRTYKIEGGLHSPSVFIDESKNLVEITGNSTLKETNWFYSNVLRWIVAFNSDTATIKVVNIKLNSINAGSSKKLAALLTRLAILFPAHIVVNWYVEGDNSVLSSGQMLKNLSGVKVNLI
jgi:hypothetical protein